MQTSVTAVFPCQRPNPWDWLNKLWGSIQPRLRTTVLDVNGFLSLASSSYRVYFIHLLLRFSTPSSITYTISFFMTFSFFFVQNNKFFLLIKIILLLFKKFSIRLFVEKWAKIELIFLNDTEQRHFLGNCEDINHGFNFIRVHLTYLGSLAI